MLTRRFGPVPAHAPRGRQRGCIPKRRSILTFGPAMPENRASSRAEQFILRPINSRPTTQLPRPHFVYSYVIEGGITTCDPQCESRLIDVKSRMLASED